MFFKRLAVISIPLALTVAASAEPPVSDKAMPDKPDKAMPDKADKTMPDKADKATKMAMTLSALHAVSEWSTKLSEMADKNAKSDLVKTYAKDMATANAAADEKIQTIAQKAGVELAPLDPQTEAGKSLLDRMKGETALLSSLQGDAFDKEFMTLVTNTQQSVIHVLDAGKASAKDPDVKQFLADTEAKVQKRLKTAQDIMAKIYGNTI